MTTALKVQGAPGQCLPTSSWRETAQLHGLNSGKVYFRLIISNFEECCLSPLENKFHVVGKVK